VRALRHRYRPSSLLGMLGVLLAGAGCDADPAPTTNLEYMPDMVASVAYDSFAPNPVTRDGRTLMAPPAGTIPRGYRPLHFGPGPEEAARAARELTNPIPDVPAATERGRVAFQRWCSPCHGHEGLGDGLVATRFPRPPSLTAPHARGLADGQLFHIVTFGQGLMPPYGQLVTQDDRWKIARYLRQLQAGEVTAAGVTANAAVPATAPAAATVPAAAAGPVPAPASAPEKKKP